MEIKKDTERGRQEVADRVVKVQKAVAQQLANVRNSMPDFEPIRNEYKQQWEKLVDELMADKTIKEFVEFL